VVAVIFATGLNLDDFFVAESDLLVPCGISAEDMNSSALSINTRENASFAPDFMVRIETPIEDDCKS
jgi:hypothetical protein